jgi:hypothetical protein
MLRRRGNPRMRRSPVENRQDLEPVRVDQHVFVYEIAVNETTDLGNVFQQRPEDTPCLHSGIA